MAGNTNDTNEDIRSTINSIDDASDENRLSSNNQSYLIEQDDADFKTSEPVADAAEAMVSEGNLAVRRVLQAAENTVSSNTNSIDHVNTPDPRSRIEDMDLMATGTGPQPCVSPPPPPPINQTQSQINARTTDNNQQQLGTRKHIMISYNRATATTVCQKIYDRLTEGGYEVWFDRTNLTYGSIIDAMGEAIDNAYVVLLCMNEGYSNSRYCVKEAKYAEESNVPLIPCMMEENYRPCGGLGFIKSDLKHIEFFDDNKFDESFVELTSQIDAIKARSDMRSALVNNVDFCDRFKAILAEYILSIRNWHLRQGNLDETELSTVLHRLIQEFSPETLQSFQNDPPNGVADRPIQAGDNNRLIQHLLENNTRLAELVRIEQENHARIEQHLLEQDDRLAAFQRFQQRQEQEHEHVRLNFNEHFLSLFHIQEVQQQGQERNDRIAGQLVQQIEQLTKLVINQQQQHARETETLHQLVNRSFEASSNTQQQQASHFDLNTFRDLIQIIVLLCTLLVLLKD